MVDVKNQRRMAADLLDCGRNRVWIDPDHIDEVANAITRDDIRRFIRQGLIRKRAEQGVSRGRARKTAQQKEKGRRKGPGSRKGASGARESKKERWMRTIRPLRRRLKELRDEGDITSRQYRTLYREAKGGAFRNVNHLETHMKQVGILEEED